MRLHSSKSPSKNKQVFQLHRKTFVHPAKKYQKSNSPIEATENKLISGEQKQSSFLVNVFQYFSGLFKRNSYTFDIQEQERRFKNRYAFALKQKNINKECSLVYIKAGFSRGSIKRWMNLGFGPVQANKWRNLIFDCFDAKKWADYNFYPKEAAFWRSLRYSPKEAYEAKRGGLTADEAWIQKNMEVNP